MTRLEYKHKACHNCFLRGCKANSCKAPKGLLAKGFSTTRPTSVDTGTSSPSSTQTGENAPPANYPSGAAAPAADANSAAATKPSTTVDQSTGHTEEKSADLLSTPSITSAEDIVTRTDAPCPSGEAAAAAPAPAGGSTELTTLGTAASHGALLPPPSFFGRGGGGVLF